MPISNPISVVLHSFAKLETRNMTAASGDVSYTGYGFLPRALIIFSARNANLEAAWGVCDVGLRESCIYLSYAPGRFGLGSYILHIITGATPDYQRAIVKSLDTDGFTLTWTKAGTPSGTIDMAVLALR